MKLQSLRVAGWVPCILLTVGCAATPAVEFDQARAFELLEQQCAFGPRNPGSPGAAAALDYFRTHLEQHADRLLEHGFDWPDPYQKRVLRLTNLMASFRPELRRRIAFAAHWDTRPRADQESDPAKREQPILGANDGASGVAVLLALAEILDRHPPEVGVDLLLFDGEDYGVEGDAAHYLIGSRRFVRDHPRYRPEGLVLLDMIGDADLSIPMERYSLEQAPEWTQRVFQLAVELGLSAFDPRPGRAVYDDHIPFLQARIPAVDLIDMDYPAWHTLADTPEQCAPASLGQVGRLLLRLIADFAE
jgi:hypothetical protein